MKLKNIFTLLLPLFVTHLTRAQATLEVVTKTIEKILPYNATGSILITGENSTIHVDRWEKPEVRIKVRLITKHRIKSVATEELENIKYLVEKKGNDIYLRNYFLSNEIKSTGCILKVEYELTVPAQCNFIIKNNLGNVDIKNTEGRLTVEAKFGNINLSNVKGAVSINLSVGDIQANQIAGTTVVKANHAHIEMENLFGKYDLKLVNSDLSFKPINRIEQLNVETKNGDVIYMLNNPEGYNYKLSTSYGEIKVPEIFKDKLHIEKNKALFESFTKKNTGSPLNIKSEFGNITLINNN